jgi:hypothetical protein
MMPPLASQGATRTLEPLPILKRSGAPPDLSWLVDLTIGQQSFPD